eukprot:2305645-Rhodomonas_salina.1
MDGNKILRLRTQTKDYNSTSTEFMKLVNFDSVENDILTWSFQAQIAKAVPRDKHNIFNQKELMEFPLSPILKWHALYLTYDPHLNTDPTMYWNTLTTMMADSEELNLSTGKVSSWVSRVSNTHKDSDLVKCESTEQQIQLSLDQ